MPLYYAFCTRLAEAGKLLQVIKEAARHSDVSTSMIYVHMANEHLKSELDDVFG
jgi:site-specific recombinase XerD